MKKKMLFIGSSLALLTMFAAAVFCERSSLAADDAREIEEFMKLEKEIEQEKEKTLVEHFFSEGKRLFKEGDYESAIEDATRILEGHRRLLGSFRDRRRLTGRRGA